MSKGISLLIGCLLVAVFAPAQALRVMVVDKNNGDPVPFAYVHALSATNNALLNTVQADEKGIAYITPEQYPCYIEVTAIGFEPGKKSLYSIPVNTTLVFYLPKKFSTLNEVVVTGLTAPKKQQDALSVYKIITREQIQAQGAVTLNEVMKNQLNVRVSNDNVLGTGMRMQGLSGDKVKILIDGLPVNGREGGNINLSQLNMNNVDRIEVIQGPMSVVYGTDALGGVVNIITRKVRSPFAVNAGVYYESIGKYNFDASVTKRFLTRHSITVGGGRNFFQGWKEIEQVKTYNNQVLNYSRSMLFKPNEQYLGNFAYSYRAPSGFAADLASDYVKDYVANKGNLEAWDPFNGAYTNDEYYRTHRLMNRLSLSGKLGKSGKWQSQNGYMLYYRTRNSYVKDMVTLNQELDARQGSQDTSAFTDIYTRSSYNNSIGRLEYTAGYDINLQYATSLKITGKEKDIQDYAAYLNLSYELIKDKLRAQAGVRGSYNSMYKPPVIPSVNLLYTPLKKLQLRASYAKGYRAPSLKEMYLSFIDINHYVIGNEYLKAESSQHVQLSASYQLYERKNDYLQFILTGFYNDVYDGITLAPINPDDPTSIEYTYANISHQSNTIVTAQAEGQFRNLHYQIGYSQNFTFAEPGYYDAFSAAEATATLQYGWKKPGLNFNVFYKLSGRQPFLQSNIDGSASYNGTQNAFHLCDASIEKKLFSNKLQLIAGVKNVFDVQQPTVSGRVSSTAHGGGISSFLPRSVFTSLRLSIN